VHERLDVLAQDMRRLEEGLRELIGTTIPVLQAVQRTTAVHPVAPGAREGLTMDELAHVLRSIVGEEAENRRRLWRLREDPDYERAYREPQPPVSVAVATRGRATELIQRSLPSILGQSYAELEVIVVGDAAPPEVEQAVLSLGDPRLTYRNLTQRLVVDDDEAKHWLVGSTMARNEALRMAQGLWVLSFDDDDELEPTAIETLIAHARERRLEVAYGQTREVGSAGQTNTLGAFPPRPGDFTWAAAVYHQGLRFFERELVAAEFGIPGDWYLLDRMLRAGVRFGMVADTVVTYYTSRG
jgi:glycosyltransferase involved in cell wall biosynthesis